MTLTCTAETPGARSSSTQPVPSPWEVPGQLQLVPQLQVVGLPRLFTQ